MNIRKTCAAALVLAALSALEAKARAEEPPAPPAAPVTKTENAAGAPEPAPEVKKPARLRPYSPTARCGNRRPGATGRFLRRGAH